MKGDKKLLVIAVLLLLISVSFTTYAIYRESTVANGNIRTANWVVNVGKGTSATTPISSANITFTAADLNCGSTQYGKNTTIAPGDSCTIQFTVDATGSEVDVVVDAELESSSGLPTGMTVTPSYEGGNTIAYATTGMTKNITLAVVWPGAVTDNETKDGTDLAKKASDLSIPVKITVRQDAPAS